MVLDLHKKTYFLITGASRGIGRTMAIRVAAKLGADSLVVLVARNADGLASTKAAIESGRSDLHVRTESIDLSKATAEHFQLLLTESLQSSGTTAASYERAFIIHNAGTTGDVSKRAKELGDTAMWNDYYHLNVFSVVALNCEFLRVFAAVPSKIVVNISSLCALKPFASMALYCSGKSARDMYFSALAVEEERDNNKGIVILSYAPGAIDTDMTMAMQNESSDPDVRQMFKQQRDTKTILTTEQTTEKFLKVLEEQNFKNGDHVDYWD